MVSGVNFAGGLVGFFTPGIFELGAEISIAVAESDAGHPGIVVYFQSVAEGFVGIADVMVNDTAADAHIKTVAFGRGRRGQTHRHDKGRKCR